MRSLGFEVCPFISLTEKVSMEELETGIRYLKNAADDRMLPIDGMILRYDSFPIPETVEGQATIIRTA